MQNSSRSTRWALLHEAQERRWNKTSLSSKRKETPKISVIAPNLNEEKYLGSFLSSLTHQTFKDFEVIIIDGFSQDRSLDIIKQYSNMLKIKVVLDSTRNFGYLRRLGASYAEGDIMFHCNSDNYFPPNLLEEIDKFYREHLNVVSTTGRTFPIGTSVFAHLAYQLFDFVRFAFTTFPMPIKKYRPGGSFTTVRSTFYYKIGGHADATVNEDGLFGGKVEEHIHHRKQVVFNLDQYVGHHVKKFESMGGPKAILFYFYTLGNFLPMLQPFLKSTLCFAESVFIGQEMNRLSLHDLWEWL